MYELSPEPPNTPNPFNRTGLFTENVTSVTGRSGNPTSRDEKRDVDSKIFSFFFEEVNGRPVSAATSGYEEQRASSLLREIRNSPAF